MAQTWTPSPEQVHALIPTRNNGQPFSATSTPTVVEVATLAEGVTAEIVATVGELPAVTETGARALHDLATWTAQLGTAALVELGEFPEQSGFGDPVSSTGAALYGRYRRALELLQRKVGGFGNSGVRSIALTVFADDAYDDVLAN